ncbi:endonuclease/exonuclease/phosphatase family protein [Paenibacillus sp. OV219]|uniref:endonuclease/exonuclease/phosphatase family protein n=1 Tax=Paenibacillus sp. OV219 TaxID=1884377 RepID=UPI000B8147AE|nr:endonuclease/exonuclease/phosphatase family protein [Paenibacillus sp. OV219]
MMMDQVKIMTLNTWLGGEAVHEGVPKLARAVSFSGADIVGFQETPDPAEAVAKQLGWHFCQNNEGCGNCSIISKFPIVESFYLEEVSAVAAHIELPSGQRVIAVSTHLYYDPYGPYWALFDGKSAEEIIAMETEVRGKEIAAVLKALEPLVASDTPLFLMGDFNAPSHLDWTEVTQAAHNDYIIEWPVSRIVEEAGFHDSYRVIHPDPAATPGHTWSTVHTPEHPWGDNPFEPQDRIDFLYYHGSRVVVTASEVVVHGEPQGFGSHEQNEWPSDHAAVMSTFQIKPL